MVNAVSNYNEWVASLNARGIKTTSLGSKEANFSDYTNALSDSLKQEIAASFDTDADYDLQAKLASLLNGSNLIQSKDMKKVLAGTGISYSVQYVQTSYIVDNKKGGKYSNNTNAINGSIAVYTFKDANGGEIKIADANGNGALESEELFMNELLSGVVSDISSASAGSFGGNGASEVQNNNQEKINQLLTELSNQLAEEQRRLAEQTAKLLSDLQSTNTTVFDAKEEKIESKTAPKEDKKADKDDIEKEAKNLIYEKYPKVTTVMANKLADKAVEIASGDIENIEDAVDEVLKELEEAA